LQAAQDGLPAPIPATNMLAGLFHRTQAALYYRTQALCDYCFRRVYCSPFGLIVYFFTFPVAELYFRKLVARFVAVRHRNPHTTFHALTDPAEAMRFWEIQLLEPPEVLQTMIRGWYLPSDPSLRLCRENVCEFFLWNLHNVSVDEADAWQRATVDSLLLRVEAVIGRLRPGREPRLRCLCCS